MVDFAEALKSARLAAGLSQTGLAARSGVARPNIVAYEAGRREPRFDSALALLAHAGADVVIEPRVTWSWTEDRRPFAVPSCLWRLDPAAALRTLNAAPHIWWSGPPRAFDLSRRPDRLRAYEVILREGDPDDIAEVVDGVLLCEAWSDLVLPRTLRSAWQPLIEASAVDAPTAVAS